MNRFVFTITLLLLFYAFGFAQKAKPKPRPTPVKPAVKSSIDKGTVSGRTYTNKTYGFEVTFPDAWLIPGDDFEAYMKKQGVDLSFKAPDSLPPATKTKIKQAVKQVNILLTVYSDLPGIPEISVVRISVEDLSANPQIKDAVDYFDAVRAMYATMRLPPDFKYSETQAEKLGNHQFGFLDASSNAGKKRMYATVRNGLAIMFTLSYTNADHLETFRQVLTQGNFALK